eukprot:CFRG3092T1
MVNMTSLSTASQEAPQYDPQYVGQNFVKQYFTVLSQKPNQLHMFYNPASLFVHGDDAAGSVDAPSSCGVEEFRAYIESLQIEKCRTSITRIDAMSSQAGSILVMVTGEMTLNDQTPRRFAQTFLLAPQDRGFYVHNDIFRFLSEDEVDVEDASEDSDMNANGVSVLPVSAVAAEPEVKNSPVTEPEVTAHVAKKGTTTVPQPSVSSAPVSTPTDTALSPADSVPTADTKPAVPPELASVASVSSSTTSSSANITASKTGDQLISQASAPISATEVAPIRISTQVASRASNEPTKNKTYAEIINPRSPNPVQHTHKTQHSKVAPQTNNQTQNNSQTTKALDSEPTNKTNRGAKSHGIYINGIACGCTEETIREAFSKLPASIRIERCDITEKNIAFLYVNNHEGVKWVLANGPWKIGGKAVTVEEKKNKSRNVSRADKESPRRENGRAGGSKNNRGSNNRPASGL